MKRMDLLVSNVRESGYTVHVPTTPDERIAAFHSIVTRASFAKIDGSDVDLFSASYVVQIYDALSAENKLRFASFPAHRMVSMAFKLAQSARAK